MKTPTKKEMKEMLQTINIKDYLFVSGELVHKKENAMTITINDLISPASYNESPSWTCDFKVSTRPNIKGIGFTYYLNDDELELFYERVGESHERFIALPLKGAALEAVEAVCGAAGGEGDGKDCERLVAALKALVVEARL